MKKTLLLWLFGLLLTAQVYAQNRTLSGTVKDEKGEALIGVNVAGKGTTIGTVTDIDGKYTLELPKDVTTLLFSYIGYTNLEKAILSPTINVVLTADAALIEEVVVTGMAIKREARSTSFAVNTISSEDLNQSSGNVFSAIQAKTPGVRINTIGGAYGASNRIVLDGEASFLLGNNALIVVDGVPVINNANSDQQQDAQQFIDFGNRGNDIDPDNIESVTVLKGPAATALYGSRGTSGVILITTKSGKSFSKEDKKFSVTVNTSVAFSKAYLQIKRQDKYGQGFDNNPDPIENFSWGPAVDGVIRPWTPVVVNADGISTQLIRPYSAVKNQIENALNLGITYKNGIAIEGGTDKYSYYLAYNNVKNTGIFDNQFYKRHSVVGNVTANLSSKLTSKINIQYSRVDQRAVTGAGTANFNGPYQAILQQPINIPISELRDYNSIYHNFNGYYGGYTPNPYFAMNNFNNDAHTNNILASTELVYKPVDYITLTARVGDNLALTNIQLQQPVFKYRPAISGAAGVGDYLEELEKRNELNIDVFGNFSKEVVKKFTLGAMVGFNYNRKSLTDLYGQTQNGLVIPGYYNLNNSKDKPIVQSQYSNEGLVGLFGQLTFGYNNLLFGEFTARNDWSSTLPSGKRGFAYYSGGLSFVPTEFIKGDAKEWINYIKLRVNAGTQGKGADPYRLNSIYAASQFLTDYFGNNLPNSFPVIGLNGSTVSGYTVGNQIGNPDLKPEITVAYDAGIDLTFLKEYVHTEYTFYHKTHKDLIVQASLPASSGYTTQILNIGKIRNVGHNLLANVYAIKNIKNVNWSFRVQYAKNKGTVLKTNTSGDEITIGGLTTVSVIAKEGYPFGTFKANDFQRDPNGNIIVGASGAPIASSTQNIFGSFQADYTVGFGSSFSWKGLSFDIQFDLRKGGLFYSGTKNATDFNGTSLSSLVNNRDPYIIPNSVIDNGDGTFTPNTTPIRNLYNYVGNVPESQDLIDASYLKLREASVSYSFDKKFFKNAPVSGITLSVIGSNLKFWLPKENVYADPETNSFGQAGNVQGIEFSSTPTTRTVSVDLKIKF